MVDAGCVWFRFTAGSAKNPRPIPIPRRRALRRSKDGMVVDTKSDAIKNARKAVMEFTLIYAIPAHCPVCDKGGECDLQDWTFIDGPEDSRFTETKLFRPQHKLSSLIVLDFNRCILCKPCVRWTEEIADDDRLIYRDRGAWSSVGT